MRAGHGPSVAPLEKSGMSPKSLDYAIAVERGITRKVLGRWPTPAEL
jgi:hypothetical protein